MPEPLPPSHHDARLGADRAAELVALAPVAYRTARRLTQHVDDASAMTLAAIRALHADAGATATRAALLAALWRAINVPPGQDAASPSGPDIAAQILADHLAADEAELDRLLMSRLDASPDVDVALRQLPMPDRFLVLMVDVEDFSYEEAAQAIGLPLSAVRERLLEARARVFASLVRYVQHTSGVHVARR